MGTLYDNVSGEVLMSGIDTLSNQTKILIMGFNPGGQGLGKIAEHLLEYIDHPNPKRVRSPHNNFSSYLHQCWDESYWIRGETCEVCLESYNQEEKIKQHTHQKRVEKIADALEINLTKVLAINAIFEQSRNIAVLKSRISESLIDYFMRVYWPIHKWLINEVLDTRIIICLGNGNTESSFAFLRHALKVEASKVVLNGSYHHGKYFDSGDIRVIGIPHPSRFPISNDLKILLQNQRQLLL